MNANWRKSTRSNSQGACVEVGGWRKSAYSALGECVEVGSYRKSTRSAAGNCVEVGAGDARVGVRDTKDPHRAITLEFPASAWGAFLGTLR